MQQENICSYVAGMTKIPDAAGIVVAGADVAGMTKIPLLKRRQRWIFSTLVFQ